MPKKKSNKQQQIKQSDGKLIKERARKLPISKCYINSAWQDLNIAHLVVTRTHVNNNLTYAVLLVDLALYGVKDVMCRFNAFSDDLEQIIDNDFLEFIEIPYELAHNIVFAALEWAEEFGFSPVDEWKTAQYIFEEDTDEIPLVEIECGIDGKPAIFYDTAVAFKSDVDKLMKTAGEGNFSIFYPDEDEDEIDPGIVAQIIDDDIEQVIPGFFDEEFDFSSKIDEIIEEVPEANIAVVNKLYFNARGWEKFESIDLIDYTIGDKEISFENHISEEQRAILDKIEANSELFNYDELLGHVKKFPDSRTFYNYLFALLYDEGIDAETGQIIEKAENLYHALHENLFVTAFYLFELVNNGQNDKFKEMLEQTNFIQKVLNYPGDIPDLIFVYYCCIRSHEELNNNNLEEADIYYFASRIFTEDLFEYPSVTMLSVKLVLEKMKVLEKISVVDDPFPESGNNHLKVVHNKNKL